MRSNPGADRAGSERPPEPLPALEASEALLAGLPGIVTVRRVPGPVLARVLAEEERYGSSAILPVLNLGVRVAAAREVVFAVLKDRSFRPPPAPTVYLVEESEGEGVPPEQQIEVDGRCYRILGEEVLPGCAPYTERNVSLGDSFVMFPGRRGNAAKPSYFLVPPLGFSELEEAAERLGIRGVFSISPSASADALLRELCGLPMDTELATLLVGFDRA